MTDLDIAVNILGGDTNKVIYDDMGLPSIVVEISEQPLTLDGIEYGADLHHPAFIVNGEAKQKFYVSKYQNIVMHGRAYSLPMQLPEFDMNFNSAVSACAKKGFGWHLMTNAEWAYLALLGYAPKGNNQGGCDYRGGERGGTRETLADMSPGNRIFTGSGPVSFSHNGESGGIWDMNGNIGEWVGGLRLSGGELQIIKDNDAADFTNSQSEDSELWRAMLESGELTLPGAGEIKLDHSSAYDVPVISRYVENIGADGTVKSETPLSALSARDVTVPHLMRLLAIAPWDAAEDGYISIKNTGIRPALRGGGWADGKKAGIRALSFCELGDYSAFGFRSCYVDLLNLSVLADEDGAALATESGIIAN